MNFHAYLLIGPPAAGKGTYGRPVGQLPGFFHLSMGAAFRGMDQRNPRQRELLQKIQPYTSRGDLVPDEIAMEVFTTHLDRLVAAGTIHPDEDQLLLDGIPRTLGQAKALVPLVTVRKVFHFVCDREEIYRRVRGRAISEGRTDDTEAVLANRLAIYDREIGPLLAFYPKELVCTLDTTQRPSRVLQQFVSFLE